MKKMEQILDHARTIESTMYVIKYAMEFIRYASDDAEKLLIGDHVAGGMDCLLNYQDKFLDELADLLAKGEEEDREPDPEDFPENRFSEGGQK